jgi:hypothetical protein
MQLANYLESEQINKGFMVLFDPREKEFREFKENQVFEEIFQNKQITTLIINIG